jgi:UDP-N-acetylglucosamine 2-epimerase (non-hydrolysing)
MRPFGCLSDRRQITTLCIVGTRPEAIKLAPVIQALRNEAWCRLRVVATAQHRDLLDQALGFFSIGVDTDLDLMRPNQTLPELTARMLPALDRELGRERAQVVLAQGDTTTVLAAALACFYRGARFAHVEAGLRTGDRRNPFPEEMNRVLIGRLADVHFAPTETARESLVREGVDDRNIVVTGNTVIDALLWTARRKLPLPVTSRNHRLLLVTAHRRESFGAPLEQICHALLDLVAIRAVEILFPVHPNPNVTAAVRRILDGHPRIHIVPPLDYPSFVGAMKASYLILTDSGGVQEEAPSLRKPVLVLRDETERPEGVAAGAAWIVGPHRHAIVARTLELLDNREAYARMAGASSPYGDGHAAGRIVTELRARFGSEAPCDTRVTQPFAAQSSPRRRRIAVASRRAATSR